MTRRIYVSLLVLLSLTASSWASVIYVSGDQTGTWSMDTVIVIAEVRVPPGQMLTILPGVEVLFSVYCKLIVDSTATLRAIGTAADSIRFDVLPPETAWHGIRFMSASDSSRLEYCFLTHGYATGSGEDSKGGAIYCSNSSPTISQNNIYGNAAAYGGGGIVCDNSSPNISGNTISSNSGIYYGGGIYCNDSSPVLNANTVSNNSSGFSGGGILCFGGSSSIINNVISGNFCNELDLSSGGGILCSGGNPVISSNTIRGNSAANGGGIICAGNTIIRDNIISDNVAYGYMDTGLGGGIFCGGGSPTVSGNTISENSANSGGGISCWDGSPFIIGNTISDNSTGQYGGGIYCSNSSLTLINCILWGNTPDQISGVAQVTYSDIEDGYTGTGNINAWPTFVDTAQGDYRLQWGSPCIDTGDPNPIYNDPDGTRVDMGAWYYDQALAVRILLTPYNAPIQIPASGGSFQYAIHATNIESVALYATIWCDVTLPSGMPHGPVLGPLTISLGAGQTLSRMRTQAVPTSAPAGIYHYNAYAVAAGDTSEDSFVFTKLGVGDRDSGFGGWANTGEDFIGGTPAVVCIGDMTPKGQAEHVPPSISPNPFNPATNISYALPEAGKVTLAVYDISGRLVTTLIDGWRSAGHHEVTFDASGLPSGIYVYRLRTGDFAASGKMVLLK